MSSVSEAQSHTSCVNTFCDWSIFDGNSSIVPHSSDLKGSITQFAQFLEFPFLLNKYLVSHLVGMRNVAAIFVSIVSINLLLFSLSDHFPVCLDSNGKDHVPAKHELCQRRLQRCVIR